MSFKPMLAETAKTVNAIRYPVIASPKLDGIRALIVDGVVMSRSFIPIPNKHIQELFGRPELNGLDGELIVGEPNDPMVFKKTSGACRREKGEPDVRFYVFDDFSDLSLGYLDRVTLAQKRCDHDRVVALQQHLVSDPVHMQNIIDYYLDDGYEGVMTRDPDGLYKAGRSTAKEQGLMRFKPFEDGEAEIIGFIEQMHNQNEAEKDAFGRTKRSSAKAGLVPAGTLGTFIVRDLKTGVEFELGTGKGLTAPLRKAIWNKREFVLGKFVKYKYQAHGTDVKPRIAVWMGFRDAFDMGEPA